MTPAGTKFVCCDLAMKAIRTFRSATVENFYARSDLRHFEKARPGEQGNSRKAKALGIAAAKVPSSSLDKISAEWLEEELIKNFPEIAARLAPKPAPEPPKPAPVEEKIVLITAPPPEPKPVIPKSEEPAAVEAKIENGEAVPPPVVEAPKIPPPAPPKPVGPQVGDKVGFIQLSPRPQPRGSERPGQAKSPPPRPGAITATRRFSQRARRPRSSNFGGPCQGGRSSAAAGQARRAGAAQICRAHDRRSHRHQAADCRARTGRRIEAEAVQDHRRPDGPRRFRHGEPGD